MGPNAKKKLLRNDYSKISSWTYNEGDSQTSRHKMGWHAVRINQSITMLILYYCSGQSHHYIRNEVRDILLKPFVCVDSNVNLFTTANEV